VTKRALARPILAATTPSIGDITHRYPAKKAASLSDKVGSSTKKEEGSALFFREGAARLLRYSATLL
jgi:hypothetical protein